MKRLPGKYVALGLLVILVWAAFLRFWNLDRRPFWCDEAWVAMTVRDLSYSELLTQTDVPLPPLFAVAVKLCGSFTACSEFAYRLFPAVCGLMLLPLTYLALRSLRAPRTVALAATGLCASGFLLVFASRQAKQYSCEAFFGVLLALLVFRVRAACSPRERWGLFVAITVVCLSGPWFGYGAALVLAVLLATLVVARPRPGQTRRTGVVVGVTGLIALAISTVVLLKLAAAAQSRNASLAEYARPNYMDVFDKISWTRAVSNTATSTVNLLIPVEWFAALTRGTRSLAILGVTALIWILAIVGLRSWPRGTRREITCWAVGPFVAMFVAAMLHRYPFALWRMVPFWAPGMLVAVTAGAVTLWRGLWTMLIGRGGPALVSAAFIGLLPAGYLVGVPLEQRFMPYHDIPKLLETLKGERRLGEVVYVDVTAVPTVRYYRPDLPPPTVFAPVTAGVVPLGGHDDPELLPRTARHAGPRWWLLTTSAQGWGRYQTMREVVEQAGYTVELFERGGFDDDDGWSADLLLACRQRGQ